MYSGPKLHSMKQGKEEMHLCSMQPIGDHFLIVVVLTENDNIFLSSVHRLSHLPTEIIGFSNVRLCCRFPCNLNVFRVWIVGRTKQGTFSFGKLSITHH